MKCWRCGAEIHSDAAYCRKCGVKQERKTPASEVGRILRRVYDLRGADAVLGKDEKTILDALQEANTVSRDVCDSFRAAMQSGVGKLYLTQIRQSGAPDRQFTKKVRSTLMKNAGLDRDSAKQLMHWFDSMIGWQKKESETGEKNGGMLNGHEVVVKIVGGDDNEKVSPQEIKMFQKAAEQGDAVAQTMYGELLWQGNGMKQNTREAAKWFQKAAEQGNVDAQNDLGTCYRDGVGVKQDYQQAVKWFRKSAAQGNISAKNSLGCCYLMGWGVKQDLAKAVSYFREAAEQGHTGAQRNLGECYRSGTGVPRSMEKAIKWYCMAAESGDEELKNLLKTGK